MNGTVFKKPGIVRSELNWEQLLKSLTPVEEHDGVLYKREDYFAPLGYGGINGSKLRQCIYLVNKYVNQEGEAAGLISGASIKSPQLSVGTAVALHYGLPSIHVIGSRRHTALRHENVAIAARLGASFILNPVAYNPALQSRVRDELSRNYPDHFHLNYGISLGADADPYEVEAFHRIGAEQVKNLPDVEDLVIPAGSCNSAISILYGIALFKPSIKNIHLIGIGPEKIAYTEQRLGQIRIATDIDIGKLFDRKFWQHSSKAEFYNQPLNGPYTLYHYDLHKTGFTTYQEEVPWETESGSIDFHPTYEGKVMKFLETKMPHLMVNTTCVWLVGSQPTWEPMKEWLPKDLVEEEPVLRIIE